MSSTDLERAKKKYITIRRAERRLINRLADIDWEYDVLLPEVRELALNATKLGELPEFVVETHES